MNAAGAGRDHAGMHPMKKAKQAKKTARKVVRKPNKIITGLKQALKHARKRRPKREISPQRKADPFWLDERLIPIGWAYAWKPNAPEAIGHGWSLVPFSRHAHDFPRSFQTSGFIVHGGLILAEAPADQVVAETYALTKKARALTEDMDNLLRRGEGFGGYSYGPWIAPETEEIPRSAHQSEGPPVEIAVTLVVRVPVRWRSASEYLKIPFSEYVRRRLVMEAMVLGCMDPFASDPVYEPVNLQFSPVNNFKES